MPAHAHMQYVARKQRVETYLNRDTVEQVTELAKERECSSSEVIREAVRRELQREKVDE